VRLRATGPLSALSSRGPAAPRTVPRLKRSVATSHCAGATRSYVLGPRGPAAYHFDRECFCLSPEAHSAQFLDGIAPPWPKGNA
jgi:hypothetical protein